MYSQPNDLVPLGTMPWTTRPDSLPLTIEEVRTAIWRQAGNVAKAAAMLKVPPARLRAYIKQSPRLSAELEEANEQLIDRSKEIVSEALNDEEDPQRRDSMAKFVLNTLGKAQGWGTGAGPNVNIKTSGPVVVSWGDGQAFGTPQPANNSSSNTIDHEVASK